MVAVVIVGVSCVCVLNGWLKFRYDPKNPNHKKVVLIEQNVTKKEQRIILE